MTVSGHSLDSLPRIAPLEPYVGSFDAFVRESSPSLARLAFLLTGDRQLGEDLLQTALIKLLPHWHRVAAGGDPTPYLRRTLVRTVIGWRRRRWTGEVPSPDVPEPGSGAEFAAAVDTRERLRAALLTLPVRQRTCVVLRYYEDQTEAETAAILGCKVGTVKSQTAKALAKLRVRLDNDLHIEDKEES